MNWSFTLGRDPFANAQTLGKQDAAAGQHHAEELITQEQGLEPVFSPAISTQHADLLRRSDSTLLETYESQLRSVEEALAGCCPRWLLLVLIGIVFLIEAESGVLFWKDEGITGLPRIVMAAASALTTIFLPFALLESLHHVLALLRPAEEHQS